MADGSHGRDGTAGLLLAAAHDLLAEQGHGAFSLRAVSGRAGLPASAITYHFGGRDGFVRAVFVDQLRREKERLDNARPPSGLDDGMLAEFLADRVRRSAIAERRDFGALLEALALVMRDRAASDAVNAMIDDEMDYLGALKPDLDVVARLGLTLWQMAELCCWLVLDGSAEFRLASMEGARRAVLAVQGLAIPPEAVRWQLRYRLDPTEMPEDDGLRGTKGMIADKVAEIMASGGVRQATYREIAHRAGISMSSLLHHFGSGEAMIRAGCGRMVQRWDQMARAWIAEKRRQNPGMSFGAIMHSGLFEEDPGRFPELAVALLARHDPDLVPLVEITRRQRGVITSRIAPEGETDASREAHWARAEISSLCSSAAHLLRLALAARQDRRPVLIALFDRLAGG